MTQKCLSGNQDKSWLNSLNAKEKCFNVSFLMEAHFRQCDGKKDPVHHYNERLSQNIDLVSQNNDKLSQNNNDKCIHVIFGRNIVV